MVYYIATYWIKRCKMTILAHTRQQFSDLCKIVVRNSRMPSVYFNVRTNESGSDRLVGEMKAYKLRYQHTTEDGYTDYRKTIENGKEVCVVKFKMVTA